MTCEVIGTTPAARVSTAWTASAVRRTIAERVACTIIGVEGSGWTEAGRVTFSARAGGSGTTEDEMITLYGFGRIFAEAHGETKDLRAQWALEETGLPYRVHALDHTGGELDGEAYSRISPFHQAPVIDDHGFIVAESAAVVLYLAEKAGKLIPSDVHGRTRVVQWCFAAVASVEPTLVCLDVIEIFDKDKVAGKVTAQVRKLAGRWLGEVERRLEGREWIACAEFTVADIMMSCVLRGIRKGDLMDPFPRVKAYYARCQARPAWQRTLELYAERVGASVDDIR
jgi:glutathione S-transferase